MPLRYRMYALLAMISMCLTAQREALLVTVLFLTKDVAQVHNGSSRILPPAACV